jgi:hypothetical protein
VLFFPFRYNSLRGMMETGMIGEAQGSYSWTFAICPNRIDIDLPLVAQLQRDMESASLPQQGLLYGRTQPGALQIDAREPVPVLGRNEFAVALGHSSRRVLGFYLIREGSSFYLSDSEVALVKELFPDPESVVLVIEPRPDGRAEGTFFFWRGDAFVYNLPVPFPIDAAVLADTGGVRAMAATMPPPAMVPRIWQPRSPVRRRGGAGLIAAAAMTAGALIGGWVTYRQIRSTAPILEMPVSGSVAGPQEEHRGDLEIFWDPRQPAVSTAMTGLLQIDDGGIKRQIPLGTNELRFGSVLYSPTTDRVQVALATRQADGTTFAMEASTRPANTALPAAPARSVERAVYQPQPPRPPVITVKTGEIQQQHPPVKQFAVETARLPLPATPAVVDAPHDLPPVAPPETALTAKLPVVLPTPTLPAPPAPSAPAPSVPAAAVRTVPRSGRLIWTGSLSRRGLVEVDGHTVSIGSLTGALPGAPVNLAIYPAEFKDQGLEVYTTDASRHNRTEAPNAANGWNRITYIWDPERVKELTVLEAPNTSNHFARLALRSDSRRCNMIFIDWATK